jgi:ribonuclease P protein component
MKRKNRLTKSSDFKEAIKGSVTVRTPGYQIFVKPNFVGHLRIGISTSKKLGNAVTRVRVRRQIRAFFTVYNMYEKRYDIVIVAKPEFTKRTSSENREELKNKLDSMMTEEKK